MNAKYLINVINTMIKHIKKFDIKKNLKLQMISF